MFTKHLNWILFFVITIECSCERVIRTDYFFSNNFHGEVAIIYGYDSGMNVLLQNGRKQYFIPESGIVLTKEKYQEGTLDQKFYIADRKNLKEIYPNLYEKDSSKNFIFFDRIEEILCNTGNNSTKEYFIKLFFVGKKMDSSDNNKQFFFENHIRRLIGCQE